MTDAWDILSSLAAAIGAFFAAVALFQSAQTTRRAETFQHLRDVNSALNALGDVDIPDLQTEILQYFNHERDALSPAGSRYKQFLDTLELLSFATEEGAVDTRIASKYLRSISQGHMVQSAFLLEYQRAARNSYCYECLLRFARREQHRLPPMIGVKDA